MARFVFGYDQRFCKNAQPYEVRSLGFGVFPTSAHRWFLKKSDIYALLATTIVSLLNSIYSPGNALPYTGHRC